MKRFDFMVLTGNTGVYKAIDLPSMSSARKEAKRLAVLYGAKVDVWSTTNGLETYQNNEI